MACLLRWRSAEGDVLSQPLLGTGFCVMILDRFVSGWGFCCSTPTNGILRNEVQLFYSRASDLPYSVSKFQTQKWEGERHPRGWFCISLFPRDRWLEKTLWASLSHSLPFLSHFFLFVGFHNFRILILLTKESGKVTDGKTETITMFGLKFYSALILDSPLYSIRVG